jgi:putative spermidine/putrescine transport system ATP-binding protein
MNAAGERGHQIDLTGLGHSYGAVTALSKIDLTIEPGELVALLGPSGCGKTTLLRIIAGFVFPKFGEVAIGGVNVTYVPAGRRNVGIVFQNYALFPHMTVARNVGYGLRARHIARSLVEERVQEMLDLVQMSKYLERYPGELSGGQQQRVALARALAVRPQIMLLDEPFSALDRGLRLDMQMEVKSLLKGYGVTSILVTHDQEEALSMADRIVVLNDGKIEQVGTASGLYDQPASLFVNKFLGQTNLLPATISGQIGSKVSLALDCGVSLEVPASRIWPKGDRVVLSVRPENLSIVAGPTDKTIPAVVSHFAPLGAVDLIEARANCGTPIKIARAHRSGENVVVDGQKIWLAIESRAACSLFDNPTSRIDKRDA